MNEDAVYLATNFAAGLVLGAVYLTALWLVVRRLSRSQHPGLWILGSGVFRIGLLLAAWYGVSGGKWQGVLACLLGFVLIRFAATRLVRTGLERATPS